MAGLHSCSSSWRVGPWRSKPFCVTSPERKTTKSKPNLKRKAPNVTLLPKRLKQSRTTIRTHQAKLNDQLRLQHKQDQQHKQDHEEQQRLLAVYRAARKKIELQAKLVVEAVEAFVDELQEQKTE